jgi:predicted DNA-binding transcriptional regulator AlpA
MADQQTTRETKCPNRHHLDSRAHKLAHEPDAAGPKDALLSTSQLAQWLGVSIQWLEIGRHRGYGPQFIRVTGRIIRYKRSDVLAWLDERAHRCTAEYGKVEG